MSVELSPSQTTTNLTLPEVSSVSEHSFSLTVTIDPIKLVSAIKKLPVIQARWNEAKLQKRVVIVKNYVAYLQARQASKIAAYRMQKLTANRLNSQTTSPGSVDHLANPEYVTAATQMLNTSTNERVALEELAASVGLSLQKTIAIINGQ